VTIEAEAENESAALALQREREAFAAAAAVEFRALERKFEEAEALRAKNACLVC
jgi:hypothetical protein